MIELVTIVVSLLLLLLLTFIRRKSTPKLRPIPALTRLYRAIGLSVEDGTRLHISLGRGGLLTGRGGASLSGLSALRYLVERTSASDRPPVATSGDPALALLSQDTLKAGYQATGADELYQPTTGRLSGMSPFSFAAGAMPVVRDENVSANVMLGDFGPESALIIESAERVNIPTLGGTDDVSAQAVLYAAAQEPLIGEEMFAAGAYLGAGPAHSASLTVQDVLRWLIVLFLLVGAGLKFLGLF
ncbi:MAG TPA: DUF6754 domain-containing protein [Anaerolineales bacterium]|nr:DUF6754 domain-containing protein [Anaerolineales bacterium]